MTDQKSDDKGKKLSIKKSALKDLKVQPGKEKDIKGGAGTLSQTKSATDPGCTGKGC